MPDNKSPVAVWSEKDVVDGQVVDVLAVVLRTRGCFWSSKSGCLMCGYSNDCSSSVTGNDLVAQFELAMTRHSSQPFLKIYNSGSFFNEDEIEFEAQVKILALATQKAGRVLVETRPEFVTKEKLENAAKLVKKLEVAIGLETASDDIRRKCVNKGFQFSDYEKACELLKKHDASIRTYLLLKPPYLTEKEALDDAISSVKKASEHSQVISVNPVNVQNRTVVEALWKSGSYRPPWLWSLVEVLKASSQLINIRVISAPSGGGTRRGTHNCGLCDRVVLDAVREFSLTGNASVFDKLNCKCKEEWLDLLDLERYAGTVGDLARLARPG